MESGQNVPVGIWPENPDQPEILSKVKIIPFCFVFWIGTRCSRYSDRNGTELTTLIMSALLSSLSTELLHLVVNWHTLSSIWHNIEQALKFLYYTTLWVFLGPKTRVMTRPIPIYKRPNFSLMSLLLLDNPLHWQIQSLCF